MAFGPGPWDKSYKQYREEWLQGYKRPTKKQLERAGIDYSLSSGWHRKNAEDWDKDPKHYKQRRVRSANGTYSYVPEDAYGDTIAFTARPSNKEIEQYIDNATWTYDTAIEHPGPCGHIARLMYSARRALMKVQFSKSSSMGDTVVYFRVPTAVFGTLYWLFLGDTYQASPETGEQRHAVGIEFWNLVRIRKTVHSGHFSFTYTGGGESDGAEGV